ncbi:MAG: c-type cytochrome [Bacteroidetes bacterium]|nr:c-type cytochrome [Bacteroidota bacterium]
MKTNFYKTSKLLVLGASMFFGVGSVHAQDGQALFQTNCAACHKTTDAKLVGPGMAGITEKRSKDWLKSWIRDSQGLIATGDADAKAIFAEYNNTAMPPFPQFTDPEMDALITYLETLGGAAAGSDTVPAVEIVYSDIQIAEGKQYFTGEKSFFNGGPTCISCHDVSADGVNGGFLAKDLTDVYTRLGEAGITAMITNAPFPAMNAAYLNNPVGEHEQKSIAAFLKSVSENPVEARTSGVLLMLTLGIGGFVCLLVLILLVWRERKKHSVKAQIFARQIQSIN